MKVLVIEDDESIRFTLQQILELDGFSVATAPNGREGLTLLKENGPVSVILLDLLMPVMNGWEFLAELPGCDPSISQTPVILMSATLRSPDVRVLKVSHILEKPLDIDVLVQAIHQHGVRDPEPNSDCQATASVSSLSE
jgi:CheY-like chemotaxis protein